MSSQESMERVSFWFYKCCEFVARECFKYKPKVIRSDGIEAGKEHPLVRLLENPNPLQTYEDLFYHYQYSLECFGVGYIWMVPNAVNIPCELWMSSPQHTGTNLNKGGGIDNFEILQGGSAGSTKMPPDEMFREEAFYNSTRLILNQQHPDDFWSWFDAEERIQDYVIGSFFIPKSCMGLVKDLTYGQILADSSALAEYCIDPRLKQRGEYLTKHLASKFSSNLKIVYESTIPKDPKDINSDIVLDRDVKAITPNEMRALRGRPPMESVKIDLIVNNAMITNNGHPHYVVCSQAYYPSNTIPNYIFGKNESTLKIDTPINKKIRDEFSSKKEEKSGVVVLSIGEQWFKS